MKVGVIGAGTMGSGIAQVFASTDGYEVVLCDIEESFAQRGKEKSENPWNIRLKKEDWNPPKRISSCPRSQPA